MSQHGTHRARALAALFCGCFALAAQALAVPQVATSPALAALSAGTCARVSDGDTVTLEWNPAFDHLGAVTGISEFELTFARANRLNRSGRLPPDLQLIAQQTPHGAPNTIAPTANGFFQIRFTVHLHPGDEPGTYELVSARAEPTVAAAYQGERPRMTNSPTQSSFCLDIVAAAQRRR